MSLIQHVEQLVGAHPVDQGRLDQSRLDHTRRLLGVLIARASVVAGLADKFDFLAG